jgi:hypothetical protein
MRGLEASTLRPSMSALGHKQTFAARNGMSALPPKADMCGRSWDVRFVPLMIKFSWQQDSSDHCEARSLCSATKKRRHSGCNQTDVPLIW